MLAGAVHWDAYLWPWLLHYLLHCTPYKTVRPPEASVPDDRQKLYALYDRHVIP